MGRPRRATWAMIAGGGTAGHVLPALAVGRALVARGHAAGSIGFVGSSRGIEARLVPAAGFEITLLPGRGVARRLSVSSGLAILGIVRAAVRALALLARRRPRVVLVVGGYASVPCALAAFMLRVPMVVHEQNAVPGLANRLAARFARVSATSFEGTPLPRAVTTGNPVRAEVAAVDRSPAGRAAAREALGVPAGRMVVAVFGGSLGARRINEAARGMAEAWAARADLTVYHVVGTRDWGSFVPPAAPPEAGGALVYRAVEYEERMPLLLTAADVAVCRAGGSSVAELAAVGLPAVFVPLPIAPHDHQTANASALVAAGAAVLVPDGELTPERLVAEVGPLLDDASVRQAMEVAGRALARPGAADEVASLMERHARAG
ncbi:MAG TPA: undecaprenyldiphospho-muramoylpentapeptide beta-N-acetylglucosaminyltransferase [Acidimicrobiales bacterium]|nr:undecaprenyldiphospho-muramoylpentapeptide beta-N-acetylglucosaminyltransferase [Acidimicrobiales bacterium]